MRRLILAALLSAGAGFVTFSSPVTLAAEKAVITCVAVGTHTPSGRTIWDVTITTPSEQVRSYLSLKCPTPGQIGEIVG